MGFRGLAGGEQGLPRGVLDGLFRLAVVEFRDAGDGLRVRELGQRGDRAAAEFRIRARERAEERVGGVPAQALKETERGLPDGGIVVLGEEVRGPAKRGLGLEGRQEFQAAAAHAVVGMGESVHEAGFRRLARAFELLPGRLPFLQEIGAELLDEGTDPGVVGSLRLKSEREEDDGGRKAHQRNLRTVSTIV